MAKLVHPLVIAHQDERRTIEEYVGPNFTIQRFIIHQAIPLGNHYHAVMTETFTLLKGRGTLTTAQVTPQGVVVPNSKQHYEIHDGATFRIAPYTLHTLVLDPGTELHNVIDRPFDPADLLSPIH